MKDLHRVFTKQRNERNSSAICSLGTNINGYGLRTRGKLVSTPVPKVNFLLKAAEIASTPRLNSWLPGAAEQITLIRSAKGSSVGGFTAPPVHLVCGRDAKSYRGGQAPSKLPSTVSKIRQPKYKTRSETHAKPGLSRESAAYQFLPGDFSTVPRENKIHQRLP